MHSQLRLETATGARCAARLTADAGNRYFFGTGSSLLPIDDAGCPAEIAGGCYAVSPASPSGLDTLRGLPANAGTWALHVADEVRGNTGMLRSWGVFILGESTPISVEATTWGQVKSRYR